MITSFTFGRPASQAYGAQVPAMVAGSTTTEVKTANGSTTAVAPGGPPIVCRVSTDTAVYVAFGTTPDATATASTTATGAKIYMPAGTVDYFVVQPGDKGAVATA